MESRNLLRAPDAGFTCLRNLGPQYSHVTSSPPALCTTAVANIYSMLIRRLAVTLAGLVLRDRMSRI